MSFHAIRKNGINFFLRSALSEEIASREKFLRLSEKLASREKFLRLSEKLSLQFASFATWANWQNQEIRRYHFFGQQAQPRSFVSGFFYHSGHSVSTIFTLLTDATDIYKIKKKWRIHFSYPNFFQCKAKSFARKFTQFGAMRPSR